MNDPKFLIWAFGDGYRSARSRLDLMNRWNAIHSDDLILKPNGNLVNDCVEMFQLYWARDLEKDSGE